MVAMSRYMESSPLPSWIGLSGRGEQKVGERGKRSSCASSMPLLLYSAK